MFFGDLRNSLLECLRTRVRNGQLTERSLAKLVGVSQPHMHNVLKGVRTLSPEMSDRILYHLRISALDLIDPDQLARRLQCQPPDAPVYPYLPILQGSIGPAHPWPSTVDTHQRFPVSDSNVSGMGHPVVVRLAEDVRMYPLFSHGDMVLLDQSVRARTDIDAQSLYAIKRGRVGLIRRLRLLGKSLYMVSEDCLDRPGSWERLPVEGHPLTHFVRARATLITQEVEWAV